MARSESATLPEFESLDELVDYFESHDLGDYWDQLPEAEFDKRNQGRILTVNRHSNPSPPAS